jgi:hypothetical protein
MLVAVNGPPLPLVEKTPPLPPSERVKVVLLPTAVGLPKASLVVRVMTEVALPAVTDWLEGVKDEVVAEPEVTE